MSETLLDIPDATSSSTPRVLTRNVIPSLTQGLDASDVLECYALVRSAPLHGVVNSTIRVDKMGLGFRYRPNAASPLYKHAMELTLEYGPQRLGPQLTHEATPYIQVEENSAFIAWENVGKVYYTTTISTENYVSAYFMASMTGAVLDKVLTQAVDYTTKRRRYQPFSVYSVENGKEIRSSSSWDFTQYIWQHLAHLGVEVEPILAPPIYEARIWVKGYEKVIPEPAVAHAAASFYQKLYQCLEAIGTGDYKAFMPTPAPSSSSAPTLQPSVHLVESNSAKTANTSKGTHAHKGVNRTSHSNGHPKSSRNKTSLVTNDGKKAKETSDNDDDNFKRVDDDLIIPYDGDEDADNEGNRTRLRILTGDEKEVAIGSLSPSLMPSVSGTAIPAKAEEPTHDVEKAKQAAQEAQAAADEAKQAAHTEGETKAADAAQVAATAAQKAADATSNAAIQAAMDGLRSGDGSVMSSIITTCFTDPQYDIYALDKDGALATKAYLYGDGSLYYRLNLTAPYFEIVKVDRPLPRANTLGNYGNRGDFVDWSLAFFVLGCALLSLLMLLQQMGFRFYEPLYKCQRWFFNPTRYDEEEEASLKKAEGMGFNFGEDAIPLSMGGRLTSKSPVRQTQDSGTFTHAFHAGLQLPQLTKNMQGAPETSHYETEDSEVNLGQIELQRVSSLVGTGTSNDLSQKSAALPERLTRDPDLVDLPHLKSRSKVAVPVGVNDKFHDSFD